MLKYIFKKSKVFVFLLGLGRHHWCQIWDPAGNESRTRSWPEHSVRRIRSLPETPEPEVDLPPRRLDLSCRMQQPGKSRSFDAGRGRADNHCRHSSEEPETNFIPEDIEKYSGEHFSRVHIYLNILVKTWAPLPPGFLTRVHLWTHLTVCSNGDMCECPCLNIYFLSYPLNPYLCTSKQYIQLFLIFILFIYDT